jgi:chloride channel 7
MQRHPFVVHADARLSRAYRLFRAMGLRHMYITPSRPQIVGVVTRKDLAEECAALTLGERGAEESAMDEGSVGSQGRGDHKGDGVGAAYGLPFLPYYPDNVSRESHRYAGDESPSLRNATGLRNRNPSASAAGGRDSPRPEF